MAARQVLVDSVDTISRRADMSIFLKGSTEQKVIDELTSRLSKLHNVEKVTYISAEQARQEQIEKYKNDPATGAAGFAAEVGHITSVPGGRPCGCGRRGCLERYA